jgi:hypothetical protein
VFQSVYFDLHSVNISNYVISDMYVRSFIFKATNKGGR